MVQVRGKVTWKENYIFLIQGFNFVAAATGSVSYDNIVLTKVITEV